METRERSRIPNFLRSLNDLWLKNKDKQVVIRTPQQEASSSNQENKNEINLQIAEIENSLHNWSVPIVKKCEVYKQHKFWSALMGLLGLSRSCHLWRYFPWEYGEFYWSFLYVSWHLDNFDCWILWSYICLGGNSKVGTTNFLLECDSPLVGVVFTTRTNVPLMLRNRWNTCLNYCGKIRFRVTHIFREGDACADKLVNLWFIHR